MFAYDSYRSENQPIRNMITYYADGMSDCWWKHSAVAYEASEVHVDVLQ